MILEMLKKIEKVQELDIEISTIRKKIAELPQKLSETDLQLTQAQKQKDEKQKILDEIEKGLRQQKGAMELNESRQSRSQEKLTQIKTHQEYQAVQNELESLKKSTATILDNSSKVEKECQVHRDEITKIETLVAEINAKRDVILKENSGIESGLMSELEKFLNLRTQSIDGIDKRYLSSYEKIRDSKFGIGIVRAEEGKCKGCNMRIPAQVYNELIRAKEIHACPSCRRILFYVAESSNIGNSNDSTGSQATV